MNFLRHLLGITKLNKEKNQCIREKTGAQSIVKEIKQYQIKWGDRGSTVVKALCYKSEDRWFDPSWCQWIFH